MSTSSDPFNEINILLQIQGDEKSQFNIFKQNLQETLKHLELYYLDDEDNKKKTEQLNQKISKITYRK